MELQHIDHKNVTLMSVSVSMLTLVPVLALVVPVLVTAPAVVRISLKISAPSPFNVVRAVFLIIDMHPRRGREETFNPDAYRGGRQCRRGGGQGKPCMRRNPGKD
jgi:hypothetical protein